MDSIFVKDISQPTLLLDENKCRSNIEKIYSKVKSWGIEFRPHFKTHQSKTIGKWFWDLGVRKIAVSSLKMANYFMQSSWRDILIAFPLNLRELDEILLSAQQINLKVTISDIFTLEFLSRLINLPLDVYLEIDVDFYRSGFDINNHLLIEKAIKIIEKSKFINLVGILAHNGNTYFCKSSKEVINENKKFLSKLFDLKNFLISLGHNVILSVGDTPSVSICDDFVGVDELRPGNFVFYDVKQFSIGSCETDNIAICLVVPIVAIYEQRNEIVCYGGAVHLSKDSLILDGIEIFGLVVEIYDSEWSEPVEDTYVKAIYQEHSIIKTTKEFIRKHKVGDLIGILPIHSCLTAEAMKKYLIPNSVWVDHL
ncbi:MAG: alanine racemase [Ignavibacteria bacterium]|nr:alanine racemase [Ignavibacteria bacterium]